MNYKILFPLLLAGLCAAVSTLRAQDCTSGFCPPTLTMHHVAGDISPVTKDVTYTLKADIYGTGTCALDRFLGASKSVFGNVDGLNAVSAAADADYIGFYFQWGHSKGYYTTSITSVTEEIPGYSSGEWSYTTTGSTVDDYWPASSDPCSILINENWHVMSITEFQNNGAWSRYYQDNNSLYAGFVSQGVVNASSSGSTSIWYDGTETYKAIAVWYREIYSDTRAYCRYLVCSGTDGHTVYNSYDYDEHNLYQYYAMPVMCIMEY